MNYLFGFALSYIVITTASIYDYEISSPEGSSIHFDDFRNKKILLVNIATGSNRAGQLAQLQQLHEQYGDSLVIIAFPSNSFGNEPRNNAGISLFCQSEYGVTFLLAAKGSVKGANRQPLYRWVTEKAKNGILDSEVNGDFQKYLVDKNGDILGVFAGSVSPLDPQLTAAITGSLN